MELGLDIALVGLLIASLLHALRLQRALGMLKQDRATLEALVASFNSSTQQAEQGIERLRAAAEGAGRQLSREIDRGIGLKDDLLFLCERADRVADRLEAALRGARAVQLDALPESLSPPTLRAVRDNPPVETSPVEIPFGPADQDGANTRLRSQAERDLLKALRMAR
jgi:hypothetical protein